MNIENLKNNAAKCARGVALAGAVWISGTGPLYAGAVDLADVPLYVVEGVDPNIVLTMDDSGSMAWSHMPNEICGDDGTNRGKSSTYNVLYYDPDVNYLPPRKADGTSFDDASFTGAPMDGFDSNSTTVDLSSDFRPTWGGDDNVCPTDYAGSAETAYYYVFDSTNAVDAQTGCDITNADHVNNDDCYDKVVVSATSGPDNSDERTNFANWYSYYRTRQLLAKTALSRAFANLSPNVRVAYQAINADSSVSDLVQFSGSGRTSFFDWLYDVGANGSTPLRRAFKRAGDLFENAGPYRDDPSDANGAERACRQNFHIAMTDGYWNSSAGISGNKDGSSWNNIPTNDFGVSSYSPTASYAEAFSDDNDHYLADNAFYYWIRDLRPDLANSVPTNIVSRRDLDGDETVEDWEIFWDPANDPANWQHMVNFTVGLGVNGALAYPDAYEDLLDGTQNWGSDEIDDLWHAAINSRGRYFSARKPDELVDAFSQAINDIADRTGSAAPLALTSGTISAASKVFQVRFNTADWTGQLVARTISDGSGNGACDVSDPPGAVCGVEWEASCKLDGGDCALTNDTSAGLDWDADREIITYDPGLAGGGIPFRWTSLTTSLGGQQDILNSTDSLGPQRVNYVRGDDSNELANGGTFRNRRSLLGDMLHSNPVFVGAPIRRYPDNMESANYSDFRTTHENRANMVFAGANDGMLHGFDIATGVEKIAYVPNAVFENLVDFTSSGYAHESYVDGPLTEGDAFFGGAWHTVLVGGLRLGGQAVFALDITDPSTFDEANAADLVLWEFSDDDDEDLGYTFSKPRIVKLNTGQWAAIFGNGYNNTASDGNASTTGEAVLYIVNIADGSLIKKISTGVGSADDPENSGRPNGLADVTPADLDGDFQVDTVYAGDLFGNLWKFDLSDTNTNFWDVAFGNNNNPEPLFVATDTDNNRQPITTPPQLSFHPNSGGILVYFGTGKYLGQSDIADTSAQTFYAVWDKGEDHTAFTRAHLLQQEVTDTVTDQFALFDARFTTDNRIEWHSGDGVPGPDDTSSLGWFMDLPESGERVHQPPVLHAGRVIFVTVTPSGDPCSSGGTSWLMELDANDGSRLAFSPFDYTNDGYITLDDLVQSATVDVDDDGVVGDEDDKGGGGGIRKPNAGIYTTPVIVKLPNDGHPPDEQKMMSTSSGDILSVGEDSGISSERGWREIR